MVERDRLVAWVSRVAIYFWLALAWRLYGDIALAHGAGETKSL